MNAIELQTSFFKHIRQHLPGHLTLVDEVASLLNISTDSAYRRIRGEKALTFDEIQVLATHLQLSIDQFLHLDNSALMFSSNHIRREKFDFESYLQGIVSQLSFFASAEKKEMYYLNKDIPLFHHFMFPELAAFKCYFWSRYNLDYPAFNKGQFLIDDFIGIFNTTGKKIYEKYLEIPSTEVWNIDCINTTIRQIEYYKESRLFKSQQDIDTVYQCLDKLVDHLEQQVELGYKFQYGKPGEVAGARYNVFVNEFVLGDNTIVVEMDGRRMVFLNHNVINYIMTTNEEFVEYTFDTLKVLLKKATLISETGEKERQRFFDTLRQRIAEKRKPVK